MSYDKDYKTTACHGLIVEGPEDFINQITQALDLISSHAAREFNEVIYRYVSRIKQAPPPPTSQSGMAAYEDPPTYYQGRATTFHSLEWCASCIAHDAYHSKLYHEHLQANPDERVPDEVWGGPPIELVCNKFQIQVGEKIGLPDSDLKRLGELDGSHALLDEIDW